MISSTSLTLKEAAVVSGTPEKTIRHELAARVVRAGHRRGRRRFDASDVTYFFLVNELPVTLERSVRRELFEMLATGKPQVGRWRRENHVLVLEGTVPLVLRTDDFFKRVDARIRAFLKGRARLVSRPDLLGGEPTFEGTRISVRFVGGRAQKGEPLEELLADYPALSREDVEFARMFVALGPAPGRPRKRPKWVRESR